MSESDPRQVLAGVTYRTQRRDNRTAERIKALTLLRKASTSDEEFDTLRQMLGIEWEWVVTPAPDDDVQPRGKHYRRNLYSGPARL